MVVKNVLVIHLEALAILMECNMESIMAEADTVEVIREVAVVIRITANLPISSMEQAPLPMEEVRLQLPHSLRDLENNQ